MAEDGMAKNKPTKYEKWWRKLHRIEKFLFRIFFPYKKYGHTEVYDDRNYIFVCNHLSFLDVFFVLVATSKPIHFIAKKELFEKGIFKNFVVKCQCIKVSRDGTDVKAVMQSMKYLKDGENISVFPEGTRNRSEEILLPFKSGASALSIKTKTPIVPIVQLHKAKFLRRSRVLYGEPLEFSEYYDRRLCDADIAECDEKLRNTMIEMYTWLEDMTGKRKHKKK